MQCIGVDVGKQVLVTYDGEKERVFRNTKGLPEFAEFVNHGRKVLIVFEATSTYSRKQVRDALSGEEHPHGEA
jgi:transposase